MTRQVAQGSSIRTVTEPVGSYLARTGVDFGGHLGFQGEASGFRGENIARGVGSVSTGNSGATGFHSAGLTGGGPRGGSGGGGANSSGGFQGGGSVSRGGSGGGLPSRW